MRAVILGGAACLWDDLKALGDISDAIVIAINDAGVDYPDRIDHWASLHPNKFPEWKRRRAEKGGNSDFLTWGELDPALVDRIRIGWSHGSSGLFAVGVGWGLGADPIILCGVPMQKSQAHYFDPLPWDGAPVHVPAWKQRRYTMKGRVFSMSGWTRELLGAPSGVESLAGT